MWKYMNVDPVPRGSELSHLKQQPPRRFPCYLNVHVDKPVLQWKHMDIFFPIFTCESH